METKLTLKLNKDIIEQAKEYAIKHNISLSRLIEKYLKLLVRPEKKKDEITPLIKELSGVIKFTGDFDPEESYHQHLEEKYLK
jgi:hypothetical protein